MFRYLRNPPIRKVLLICLILYVFSAKGDIEVEDTSYSLQTARALWAHQQLDIPHAESYTEVGKDGRSYSKYGLGLALYYVPWVAASGAFARATGLPTDSVLSFLISFAAIPFGILTLLLFAGVLEAIDVAGAYVWIFSLLLGLGTLAWSYAANDFSEEMQMCLLLVALYGVLRRSPRAIAAGGAGFACLFLVKLVWAAFLPLFLAYLLTRPLSVRERVQRTALFALPFVITAGSLVWLNISRFGNPLESGYGREAQQFFPGQVGHTLPQLLFSLDKGLFVYCPILILAIFGWKEFIATRRGDAVLCAALVIENLLISSAWHSWGGGWSWGPRLLVPLIPIWLLPAAMWFNARRSRPMVWVLAVFAAISLIAELPGLLVKNNEISVIQEDASTVHERPLALSSYGASWIILRHKVSGKSELYQVSDFNVPRQQQLDLTRFRTYNGLNIWTEQVARRMNLPQLRWLIVPALFLCGYLAMGLGTTLKTGADGVRVRLRPAPEGSHVPTISGLGSV